MHAAAKPGLRQFRQSAPVPFITSHPPSRPPSRPPSHPPTGSHPLGWHPPTPCPPLQIYWDGLLVASALTGKTKPLQPGGALMLGAEQDCYGGCTDRWGLPALAAATWNWDCLYTACLGIVSKIVVPEPAATGTHLPTSTGALRPATPAC